MKTAVLQDSDLTDLQRLHHVIFSSLNLSSFLWQPCQQTESITKSCIKLVVQESQTLGYAAAYRLDETHFRLNLLVDPQATRRGIGTLLLERMPIHMFGDISVDLFVVCAC